MSSLLFSCSHPISRLKSSSGARHQRSISARACVTPLPSASGWTSGRRDIKASRGGVPNCPNRNQVMQFGTPPRSEEHTSELQSRLHLVCRLLLEKKKHRDPTPAYAHFT